MAAHLIRRGLQGKKIFVLGERSALTPVVYLGVARAGGCYIPIDATLNPERIRQIMDFVEDAPVIAFRSLTGILDGVQFDGERLIAEDLLENECDEDVEAAENEIIATQPLYIIFTSGSTGKPKGVITSHASLMNYVEAVNEVLDLKEDDVLGNQSPLDYIASIRDIYLPLLTGASTVIIPKNQFSIVDPGYLSAAADRGVHGDHSEESVLHDAGTAENAERATDHGALLERVRDGTVQQAAPV